MSRIISMDNFKTEYLEVLNFEGLNKEKKALFKCKCRCGKIFVTLGKSLRNGNTKSCGCMKLSIMKKQGFKNKTHGKTNTRLFGIWRGIKKRCRLKTNVSYKKYYGSKGIDIYDEWYDNFENFYNWSINNGYKENLTIDRIDNTKGYYPNNCRWVSMLEQQNNRTNNTKVIYNSMEITKSKLSRILKISPQLLEYRLKRGIYKITDGKFTKDE